MSEVVAYVGIDAHKRDLHVAMLGEAAATLVTWLVEMSPRRLNAPIASSSARHQAA